MQWLKRVYILRRSSLYKVCILAAGKGTRNKYVDTNKALLPIGEGTALDYIVSKFPHWVEIIIAVGYNSSVVVDFASKWGSRVKCVYVEYRGKSNGPGYSLLQCKAFLQSPFIFTACDTIVLEDCPEPTINWIGVAKVEETLPYLTIGTNGQRVKQVYDKGDENATYLASIGLVGVKDYKAFWEGLANPTIVEGEQQDTSGLNALISHKLYTKHFTWFDTGNNRGYENANRYFSKVIPG